jgi:hypothetical protein
MVPAQFETFRGARDFFGPFHGTSDSEDHFGAKKGTLVILCHLNTKATLVVKHLNEF